ncbi:hypothetical protein AVEN_168279-1 [Araneus ventricosus]|uniref:Uncharacterized protein n=1 Tax=Araneus ventricosus TaxID=182803 RepID=A0A4Y2FXG9_ARAVE|nr:hypothetical protein AVEN_168279-1 [Araneus ventricosus]
MRYILSSRILESKIFRRREKKMKGIEKCRESVRIRYVMSEVCVNGSGSHALHEICMRSLKGLFPVFLASPQYTAAVRERHRYEVGYTIDMVWNEKASFSFKRIVPFCGELCGR